VDWWVVVLMATAAGAVGAPLAAAITSIWPSRATRWAARSCLTMVAVSVVFLGLLWWESSQVELNEYGEGGDDSGVRLVMGGIIVLVGLGNLVAWAIANERARRRDATAGVDGQDVDRPRSR
jgi:hypothetical protein